ncbi:MAG: (d)CMP kinase [Proteobacteria bacterium]|nr:MAG: (d)CMP kinase [Pseudomonadota bacterium]
MSQKKPVVAIDGPAGSGKSTVAKQLAKRLGFTHIDTGALYRGVALLAIEKDAALGQEAPVVAAARGVKFEFRFTPEGNLLHLDGRNVGKLIRTEQVSAGSSKVSAYPGVRALLLDLQRDLGAGGGVVLEGRDIGTVVFPDAEVKVFLTASIEARAERRAKELREKGDPVDLEQVKTEMVRRDKQDTERAIAPLKQAADAVLVDTSGLAIDSVLDRLESIVRSKEA